MQDPIAGVHNSRAFVGVIDARVCLSAGDKIFHVINFVMSAPPALFGVVVASGACG